MELDKIKNKEKVKENYNHSYFDYQSHWEQEEENNYLTNQMEELMFKVEGLAHIFV